MANQRAKKMLLSVAAISVGAATPMACSSGGFVGDVAVPFDAADAADTGNKCGVLGKCAQDSGPDEPVVTDAFGFVPLDSSKD